MKVLVLGGAGDMGSNVAKFLTESKEIDEVHIGDLNKIRGEKLAKELGEKCKYVFIDAKNHDELVQKIKNYDLIASTLGPFYEFGPIVAKAALEAKVSLFDICDDHDATKRILEFDLEAKKSNITIITGIGWTPGLSNLLAKYAYDILEGANKIRISWVGSAADSKGLAVIMHLLYAITGKVPMFKNGEETMVEAGSSREEVEYPEPIKKAYCYYTGHPEPITLPRYLKGLKEVEVKGGLIPDWQNKLGKFFVKARLTNTASKRRRLSKFLHKIEDVFRTGGIECSAVRVDVYKGEEKISLAAADRMGKLTALPIAIASELYSQGKINEKGCFAAEGILDAKETLKIINSKGIKFYEYKEGWNELKFD
jgi:saccharopine dehydrogenase-like NADP-dependent oxidoreductase